MNTKLLIFFLMAGAASANVGAAVTVGALSCEYLHDPIGLDVAKPRLGWIVQSNERNENQTAYEVIVASTPELLVKDQGDLWDSGKVASAESTQIEYGGKTLSSRQACWWKVRAWDHSGAASTWSESAHWEMGLLEPGDWHAKWIAVPPVAAEVAVHGKISILRADFAAEDGSGSKDVTEIVSEAMNGNQLQISVGNDVLGGDPAPGHVKRLHVSYTLDGVKHETNTDEASVLTLPENTKALPYLRKDFSVDKTIVKARLYATALGLYELHLNGNRVGDQIFAPDWTDYDIRCRYQVYDVTPLVKQGANTLAGFVANGWYSGHIGNGGFRVWGTVPALYAQLELTHADGTTDSIVTDASWKMHPGPIRSTDFMLGENYNAQNEISGWDQPGLNVSDWTPATERAEASREMNGQADQQVRQTGELQPKAMTEPNPGHYIFDLGQNMVGFVRIKVAAPAGTVITLRHAEMLNSDGTVYTTNLRRAPSVDTYVCKGTGVEIWQPHFTFHGFRYVELTGLTSSPAKDAVTGIVVGTDIPKTGEFSCSNKDINQLQSNIQWGMRGNYLSVPTDCPQRDERMGWMGDAEVFIHTATYNGDVAAFFTKWLVDVDDARQDDGAYTDVAPYPKRQNIYGAGGVPAWADAGIICPWTIYLMYGDTRILQQHLPAMSRYIEWCREHSTNLIRDRDRGGDFGDWLAQGENTSKDLIGTAYFGYSTLLVAKSYAVIGDTANADKYHQLFEQIKTAFNQKYVTDDGHIQGDTQCGYAMALRFELLPDNLRSKAAQYLADDVKAHGDHLTTGFIGVGNLLPTLTAENQIDTAYRLLLQDTFPSWLFSVKQGATTIWERWDGWTPERGFQNPGMNSFNHYSLGSCGEWMFDRVAGIGVDTDQPGFKHIIIHPLPGGGLTHAEGSFESIHGKISTKWELKNGAFALAVSIPANTTATVEFPTKNSSSLQEGGRVLALNPEIKAVTGPDGFAQVKIGSGDYTFTCNGT